MKWSSVPEKYACVDAHNHVWFDRNGKLDIPGMQYLLNGTKRLGIQRVCISLPLITPQVPPKDFRAANDAVLQAMSFSDRFIGFCFVDAAFPDEAVTEIERCIVREGMAGIKMYHQHFIDDDIQAPVLRKAAELGIPVLMHAGKCTDPATMAAQPRLSNAANFLNALRKFPDTIFIQGHIGGGGDWQWNLRTLEGIASNNYYIDISGSVIDAGIVQQTAQAVGISRMLFATDGSLEEGVGKCDAAAFTDSEYAALFSGNWNTIASRRRG